MYMLLTEPKVWRCDKESLIFAVASHKVSPALYKMLCKLVDLPSVKEIKEILSKCSQDTNMKTLFDKLMPGKGWSMPFLSKSSLPGNAFYWQS